MSIFQTIHERRSIKNFTTRSVAREEIEQLLEGVVQAPNHRMTEPWRFYILGPIARRAYGAALGGRKAKRVEDPEAAEAVILKVADTHAALPCMIAISLVLDDNPEIREEDYAAVFMGLQNLSLAVSDGERIVATLHLGEPASMPEQKSRKSAIDFTTWVG